MVFGTGVVRHHLFDQCRRCSIRLSRSHHLPRRMRISSMRPVNPSADSGTSKVPPWRPYHRPGVTGRGRPVVSTAVITFAASVPDRCRALSEQEESLLSPACRIGAFLIATQPRVRRSSSRPRLQRQVHQLNRWAVRWLNLQRSGSAANRTVSRSRPATTGAVPEYNGLGPKCPR